MTYFAKYRNNNAIEDMGKFVRGFGYAFSGLYYAFKSQLNFKVHILAAFLVGIIAYWLKVSANECMWLIASVGMVLLTELLNTAIEVLVDLVSPEIHPQAKIIKDLAAAAVLIAAISAFIIGMIIFIPKALHYAA